jgi:hypothetical protein
MTVAVRGILAASAAAAVVGALAGVVVWTAPVRGSVRSYTELLSAANTQDVDAARRLCSARYVATHSLTPSPEGGIVGLPRNIHKNFQAWREGPNVWLCPTNRVGPIYQFVHESGSWRFDGPVGILRGRGQVVRLPDGGGGPLLEEGAGRVD